ncbi:MAG: UDP-N-acetylmuramoyl-L-alanine--D-glutamate ligase [Candidatus Omnitrophica bacterium]|nr:UDP-N-acetylmuramoyl-L-alanine--D-glutamate ligase [Candidatus Omnitrophota bacterium]
MYVKNKTITVVGLGNSGVNAALLLGGLGAFVKATDAHDNAATQSAKKKLEERGVKVEIGGHTEDFIKGSDLVVVSPGVEDSSPAIKWAGEFRIPVIGEMELGFRFCRGRIIAITGTNGKSTVTSLIGKMLEDGGLDTVVCGNIGNSLCGEMAGINSDTWVVLEVSSFQLEKTESFKPHIAIILNIRDDHMDRYAKFSDYFNEKLKIFRNQDENDYLILNGDAEELKVIHTSRAPLRVPYSKVLLYKKEDAVFGPSDMKLKGLHNIENVLAASMAAKLAGVSPVSIEKTAANFTGLAHRFETVGIVDGVEYIDNSKGTTVDSTYRALESCGKPVILIAGGKDKHSDYGVIKKIVKEKVKKMILIGEAAGAIRKALKGAADMVSAKDMNEAVRMAHSFADKDSIVLLSPMCSSFDMFSSYKERGEAFRKAVEKLTGSRVKV